jgi:hypothetical protein
MRTIQYSHTVLKSTVLQVGYNAYTTVQYIQHYKVQFYRFVTMRTTVQYYKVQFYRLVSMHTAVQYIQCCTIKYSFTGWFQCVLQYSTYSTIK